MSSLGTSVESNLNDQMKTAAVRIFTEHMQAYLDAQSAIKQARRDLAECENRAGSLRAFIETAETNAESLHDLMSQSFAFARAEIERRA